MNKKKKIKFPSGDLGSKKFKSVMKSDKSRFRMISWQSWRATARNPVEALRYE